MILIVVTFIYMLMCCYVMCNDHINIIEYKRILFMLVYLQYVEYMEFYVIMDVIIEEYAISRFLKILNHIT
jgi:hypothetical protein